VDAETRARLWLWIDENDLPDNSTSAKSQPEWWEESQN
jgi:hypothetical protein